MQSSIACKTPGSSAMLVAHLRSVCSEGSSIFNVSEISVYFRTNASQWHSTGYVFWRSNYAFSRKS